MLDMKGSPPIWRLTVLMIGMALGLTGQESPHTLGCLQRLTRMAEAAEREDWATVQQYSTEGLSPKGGACSSTPAMLGALYLWQGRALLHTSQPAAAIGILHRAAHHLEQAAASDSVRATVDWDLADAFVMLGQYDSLAHYFAQGIGRAESATPFYPSQRLALVCNNLGYHHSNRQVQNLAIHYYEKAVAYWHALPDTDPADLCAVYFNLGSLREDEQGMDYLLEALAIRQREGLPRFAPHAGIGSKMMHIGRYADALHYYALAIEELDTLVGIDSLAHYRYDLINTLSLRAALYLQRGDDQAAQRDLQHALSLAPTDGTYLNTRIKLRTDLAKTIYLQAGTPAAIASLKRIWHQAAQEKSYLYGYVTYNLATYYAEASDFRAAAQYALLSLRHATRDDFGTQRPRTFEDFSGATFPLNANYATLLTRYAQYLYAVPEVRALAVPHFEAALRLYEQCLEAYPDEVYIWQKYRQAALAFQQILAQQPDRTSLEAAFAASERAKSGFAQRAYAWQLTPLNTRHQAAAFAEWRNLQHRISSLREQVYYAQVDQSLAPDSTSTLQRHIFQLNQTLDSLTQHLHQVAPAFAQSQQYSPPVALRLLQQTLPDTAAFLAYSITDTLLHRYTITAQDFRHEHQPLPPDFNTLLQAFQHAVQQYGSDPLDSLYTRAHRLYSLLIPDDLPTHIRHLVLSPDDAFYQLPFEALNLNPWPQTPAFLLHEYTLSYASSATLWVQQHSTPARPTPKFWAGYVPDYTTTSPVDTLNTHLAAIVRQGRWALPGALQEGQAIERLTRGDLWQGKAATEAHFKDHAADYRILHLAMHASLNEAHPLYSKLHFQHLTPDDPTQDITVAELYTQQYRADLVVLSACNTGVGVSSTTQGLISLSNAFAAAGCPSTVMSLWQVPDATTAPLMVAFYRHLATGQNKAAALQAAKRDYLRQATTPMQLHPYFWSGLVLNGNYNAVPFPKRRPQHRVLGWGVLLFLILVAGVWRYSRTNARKS